jgi:hypothetical protein
MWIVALTWEGNRESVVAGDRIEIKKEHFQRCTLPPNSNGRMNGIGNGIKERVMMGVRKERE